MKCIVTGAAGFIGSHLVERLLADGHMVVGVDDLSSGSLNNLAEAQKNPKFFFINCDISKQSLDTQPICAGTDWLFHLAAKADVVPSIETPTIYHDTNVTGTVLILEAARAIGIKRFVYAASSSCYGIPSKYPTAEKSAIKPMYPYALTKYLGEQCVLHWSKVYRFPAISLRLFNVYGPRSRTSGAYGAVFGVFLAQLANREPLTIVGNGGQSRDFTFVTDVVDAFVKAAESNMTGEIFNIGSSIPQTINQLVELLGSPATIRVPDRPGEPRRTHARNSKACNWLNWKPRVRFEKGVEIMKALTLEYKDAPLWTRHKIAKATETWFKYLGD